MSSRSLTDFSYPNLFPHQRCLPSQATGVFQPNQSIQKHQTQAANHGSYNHGSNFIEKPYFLNPILRRVSNQPLKPSMGGIRSSNPPSASLLKNFYVANLPLHLPRFQIRQIFGKFGVVSQVFVPNKLNRAGKRFGFVRLSMDVDSNLVLSRLDGFEIDNHRLLVRETEVFKVQKEAEKSNLGVTQTPVGPKAHYVSSSAYKKRDSRSYLAVASASVPSISIKTGNENDALLNCSVVGNCLIPIAACALRMKLRKECSIDCLVRGMGGNQFLLNFPHVNDVTDVLINKQDLLRKWFDKVKRWEPKDVPSKRYAWLRCHGVPLNLWSLETFKSISSIWGSFVCLDEATLEKLAFNVGRVRVFTSFMDSIDGMVKLVQNENVYSVRVCEELFVGFSNEIDEVYGARV